MTINTLTQEQAGLLRSVRGTGTHAEDRIDWLMKKLGNFKCPHEKEGDKESEHDPDNCPVCHLYDYLTSAIQLLADFNKDLDAYLERGPEPTKKA